jgi:6-pyruvoyl-tetrahydropterin synthase
MHLFVDNLTNIDFSYLDAQRGLVGETWLASISLEGTLDEQGMVCDFGIIKKTLRHWLDTYVDHCLVVPAISTALTCQQMEQTIELTWQYADKSLSCTSPNQAISLISADEITPSSVAQWCIEQLRELLPDTIAQITLSFTPEVIEHHFYHYSHGLKKHQGNCQRIAHGHRSTLHIIRDGQRDHQLEAQWCQQWADIYVGTHSDLIDTEKSTTQTHYCFAYTSQQGSFSLDIPMDDCYLIDTDTTVELIARHIADHLKQQHPLSTFIVRAYEGIGKGAVAYS